MTNHVWINKDDGTVKMMKHTEQSNFVNEDTDHLVTRLTKHSSYKNKISPSSVPNVCVHRPLQISDFLQVKDDNYQPFHCEVKSRNQ